MMRKPQEWKTPALIQHTTTYYIGTRMRADFEKPALKKTLRRPLEVQRCVNEVCRLTVWDSKTCLSKVQLISSPHKMGIHIKLQDQIKISIFIMASLCMII